MDNNSYLLIAILVMSVISLLLRGNRDNARLARIERKLDVVLKQLGVDATTDVDPRVLELARSGQKIEAIKLYRTQTGAGLKEAKDFVESL